MMTAVQRWAAEHAIAAAMPQETLRQQVGLPSELVPKLLDGTGLHVADGVVRPGRGPASAGGQAGAHGGGVAGRRAADEPSSAPANLPRRYGPAA